MGKEILRTKLKQERSQVTKEQRDVWDQAILKNLLDLPAYLNAKNVMSYLSFGWEVNTWPIVDNLKQRGKDVYVPVIQNNPKSLIPRQFTTREDLKPAVFGILEPGPDALVISPEDLDLIIVPGLAFSTAGFRIGYGGGYYDRFLSTTTAVRVGLVYSSFIRDVPVESWDLAVDFLATEKGVLRRK